MRDQMPTKRKVQDEQPDGEFIEVSGEDPVIDLDELDPDNLDDLDGLFADIPEDREDFKSTQNEIVAGEQIATPFTDALQKDERYRTPSRSIKPSAAARVPASVGRDSNQADADLIS